MNRVRKSDFMKGITSTSTLNRRVEILREGKKTENIREEIQKEEQLSESIPIPVRIHCFKESENETNQSKKSDLTPQIAASSESVTTRSIKTQNYSTKSTSEQLASKSSTEKISKPLRTHKRRAPSPPLPKTGNSSSYISSVQFFPENSPAEQNPSFEMSNAQSISNSSKTIPSIKIDSPVDSDRSFECIPLESPRNPTENSPSQNISITSVTVPSDISNPLVQYNFESGSVTTIRRRTEQSQNITTVVINNGENVKIVLQ